MCASPTVPLKGKLTVSTRNSILDPRSFRESRIEFRVSIFEDRESSFEVRVSSFETLEEFFEDLEQRFRENDLNVAKYYLGKVKRERSWPVVSAFAVRDLRGGPVDFAGPPFGLVASVAFALLLCSLIVLDLLLTIVTAHCKELQILASCFLLRCCLLALVSFVVMPFTRPTNNSLSAGLDSAPQSSSPSASSNADVPIPPSSVSDSSHPAGGPDVPSPAFLTSVVAAVKQALAAEQTATSGQASGSPSTSVAGAIGGVPSTLASSHQSLQHQASAFAASGVGFPPVPAPIAGAVPPPQGRPNFLVPSFVSTFSAPLVSSVAPSPSSVTTGLSSSVPSAGPDLACPPAIVRFASGLFASPTEAGDPDRY